MITCLGSPMVDLNIKVNIDFLKKYNLTIDNAHIADGEELFSEINEGNVIKNVGGSITNTIRVINWILKTVPVVYVGAVGDDENAQFLIESLNTEGIKCVFKYLKGPTAKCAVLILDATRTLYTDLGVSGLFTLKHLMEDDILLKLQESKIIYFSAFFLNVSIECINKILTLCKQDEKKLVFNLGAAFLCRKFSIEIQEILIRTNIVIGNEQELLALGETMGFQGNCTKQVAIAINNYKNHTNRIMVVTRGAESLLLVANGKVKEYPVFQVNSIVDTNSAGDAFAGGFIAAFARGHVLEKCVDCGLWAASEIIQSIGCNFDKNKTYQF